ncbi:putative ABC transport system ATP-binding protein [Arthrobacter woluwensis]|uniref:ABC transporter ATP-binding protein n=1 Tax=Arthrobacter woluwensis TaxID=156980 RepID=UPI00277EDE33|nr:ABC transporter ATP-binding protein [Arthrobacter woluwensis]MDQ0709214.1 putative ABC transport system ATP-binding protein [Arthrobacter woluwensis]
MTTTTHQVPSPGSPSGATNLAVSARNLVKNYGKGETAVAALRDVSIDFAKGRFTAIMGPSGSGKSTLMHLLAGLDTADSGQIHLGDTEITGLNDTQLTTLRRENVGFVFQAFNLVPTLTAEQNILLPIELAGGKPDLEWFDFIVDVLGLKDRLKHRPHELSGGQQQRVAVARALLTRPHVLFGDEPTGNLDSRSGAEVLSLLRRSSKELGQTIIMVTHDPVAASYADRVILMSDGQVVGQIEEPTAESVLAAMSELGA